VIVILIFMFVGDIQDQGAERGNNKRFVKIA
jgi:hypothetical protein